MRQDNYKLLKIIIIFLILRFTLESKLSLADVIPDSTLGNENSLVTPNVSVKGSPASLIEGGASRGVNLFHSFSEFNLGNLERIYFANPTGIERIFSRVTGSNLSNIDGVLGVLGNADLFLLNPNGIIFGQNATLDVNGSFAGSTANSLVFGDEFTFSATNPTDVPPLLTVNPNVFLFGQINTAKIENRSIASAGIDIVERPVNGLRVPDGESLILLGGEIFIDGGGLHALGGEIELAAIGDSGTVELNFDDEDINLAIPTNLTRANIFLQNGAIVSVNGEQGGEIQVNAKHLELRNGSQIRSNTLGESNGKNSIINATESIIVNGTITDPSSPGGFRASGLFVGTTGTGDAGNLTVNTKNLLLEDGGQIGSNTFGQGNGGNVFVNATESIKILEERVQVNFPSSITALTVVSTGDAGNLNIFTPDLLIKDGGLITTATGGEGDSGNIVINSNFIEVTGRSIDNIAASRISTQSAAIATGNAGNLTINTDNLFIKDGAQIDSGAFVSGKGGNVTINVSNLLEVSDSRKEFSIPTGLFSRTDSTGDGQNLTITTNKLIVRDGAIVSAGTSNSGNGGDLKITAKEIESIGTNPDGNFGSGLFASSTSSIVTNLPSAGNGGEIIVDTEKLSILDGAKISANSQDEGLAGNVEITTGSINLNRGSITTETDSGDGGDISLQIDDLLLLRNNSQISTTAGIIEAGGNGGDITINSDLIVAFPQENSDITANAFNGSGGNIEINTQGIFGIEFRSEQSPVSDITASSEFGLDGTVAINTPDVNPGEELVNLPQTFATPPLDTSCQAVNSTNSSFVDLGRGGIPRNPQEIRSNRDTWEDLRHPTIDNSSDKNLKLQSSLYSPVVEAQDWIVGDKGQIILVAKSEQENDIVHILNATESINFCWQY
ncbi:MAG: hypothetical protein Tsb0014_22290 [Pleurocapsa sp.]